MTEHDDHKDNQDLSALYRSISDETSSASADAEILQLAQKESHTIRQVSWLRKWSAPISVAAVVVLSISIVTVIKQESAQSPELFSIDTEFAGTVSSDEHVVPEYDKLPQLNQEERIAAKQKPDALFKRAKPKTKNNSSIPPESSVQRSRPAQSELRLEQAVAPPAELEPIPAPESRRAVDSAIDSAVDSVTGARSQSKPAPQTMSKQIMPAGKVSALKEQKTRSKKKAISRAAPLLTPVFESEPSTSDATNKLRIPTAASAENSTPKFKVPAKQKTKLNEKLCANTSNAKCLESLTCVLIKDTSADSTGSLQCVEAKSPCEKGFTQDKDGAQLCQRNKYCWYRPGKCQCDDDGKCDCGKKGPPLCVPNS